jgi:hypothetical protein
MIPGTIIVFPLDNGLFGAGRVIRAAGKGDESFAGHVLVCATPFMGQADAVLKDPRSRKILRAELTPIYWLPGRPPSRFEEAGVIAPPKSDAGKKSRTKSEWEILPYAVYQQWREEHEPEALEAEREPVEVVRGFIAAMSQWENECGRIDKQHGQGAALGINRESQDAVIAEFCTAKERKYGRLGSYSAPSEYDPASEEILRVTLVNPRRAEVETQQHAGYKQRVCYVLLKAKGCWLIDSCKRDGQTGIL